MIKIKSPSFDTIERKYMLNIGDPAPAFELIDNKGQTITLQSFSGKRSVLFFYPKDLTPG